jgi:hypothetical protein
MICSSHTDIGFLSPDDWRRLSPETIEICTMIYSYPKKAMSRDREGRARGNTGGRRHQKQEQPQRNGHRKE